MHVAYLTPEYPHPFCPASGGLGTSIKNMAEALSIQGVQVSVIIYGQKEDRNFHEAGIDFYFIEQKAFFIGGWFFYRKKLQKTISKIIRSKRIDLIEAPDWTGITAFMRFSIPVVIRLNGTDAYFCALDNRKQKLKNRMFERLALKNADEIIAVSEFTGRKTMEVLSLKRNYTVIPNSIRTDDFLPSDKGKLSNTILYFGTIIRKKGVLELAQIFNYTVNIYEDANLLMVGRDVEDIFEKRSTLELFKELLSEKALMNFQYIGALEYKLIKEKIEQAGVVVLPSFAEALPMTWLESMAMEKALITSNIGWAPEVMIDGETGFTVNPKDHSMYAAKIITLLENRQLAETMGKTARRRVIEKFSVEKVVNQNLEFYSKLIHN